MQQVSDIFFWLRYLFNSESPYWKFLNLHQVRLTRDFSGGRKQSQEKLFKKYSEEKF